LRVPGSRVPEMHELGEVLLGELRRDPLMQQRRHLLFVADYPLNALPLAALPDGADSPRPLLTTHTVVTLPSISLYEPGARAAKNWELDLAVFADPVFSGAEIPVESAYSGFTNWLDSL